MTKHGQEVALDEQDKATVHDSGSMTKSAVTLALLKREQGSTLAELIEATAWQLHTARAMLSGLRKKGHAIVRGKRGDLTCYHLPNVGPEHGPN